MSDRDFLYVEACKLPPSMLRERIISYVVRAERSEKLCDGEWYADLDTHLVNFCRDTTMHERSEKCFADLT